MTEDWRIIVPKVDKGLRGVSVFRLGLDFLCRVIRMEFLWAGIKGDYFFRLEPYFLCHVIEMNFFVYPKRGREGAASSARIL